LQTLRKVAVSSGNTVCK